MFQTRFSSLICSLVFLAECMEYYDCVEELEIFKARLISFIQLTWPFTPNSPPSPCLRCSKTFLVGIVPIPSSASPTTVGKTGARQVLQPRFQLGVSWRVAWQVQDCVPPQGQVCPVHPVYLAPQVPDSPVLLQGQAGCSIVADVSLVMGDFIIRCTLTNVPGRIQSFGGKQY